MHRIMLEVFGRQPAGSRVGRRQQSARPQYVRGWLTGLIALLALLGCARWSGNDGEPARRAGAPAVAAEREPSAVGSGVESNEGGRRPRMGRRELAPPLREPARELSWSFPDAPFGGTDVVISIPSREDPRERFPVLVALHGRGESAKGSRRGARGWLDDYQLARAVSRLAAPPLDASDFERFVTDERLGVLNAGLSERPYAGLIVVCPFLPDVLKGSSAFRQAEPLARFIVEVLLPRVYAKTPALGTSASTGIDGVSLGGRAALLVGLTRPAAFGSVGALQAAIDAKELERWSEMAARAVAGQPDLVLRLLTSDEDYFLHVNERLSSVLTAKGVAHQLLRVTGTHSYRFNRGPGGFEMLIFHDRVLRGLPAL